MSELHEFVKEISNMVTELFNKNHEIFPMYHFINRKGEHMITPPPILKEEHEDKKGMQLAIIREFIKEKDIVRYCFFDEAWMAVLEPKEEYVKPEQHPQRREIILFNAEDENLGQITATRDIIRPVNASPCLGPLQFDTLGGLLSGRMVGMLPPKGTAQ